MTADPAPYRKALRRWNSPAIFITFSCYQRLPLFKNAAIVDLMAQRIAIVRATHRLDLFAWVIMPEHIHLLVRPAAGTKWANAALALKTPVAQAVIARWREVGAPILKRLTTQGSRVRFWQPGGGFDRNSRDIAEFTKSVQYIHRNPVKRGLVTKPQLWKWSSVRWWMGQRDGEIECDPPPGRYDWPNWRGFM